MSNKPSKLPEIHKNGEKTGGFMHILAYKSPKMPIFAQKYLIKYTHETLFDKYVNFQNHYISRCGVIPVQSFGSHIRPQPHGLGLNTTWDSVNLMMGHGCVWTTLYHRRGMTFLYFFVLVMGDGCCVLSLLYFLWGLRVFGPCIICDGVWVSLDSVDL